MSIKPNRNEILDMIIDRVQEHIVEEADDINRRLTSNESTRTQLLKERNEKRFDKLKFQQKLKTVQAGINHILKEQGFQEVSVELSVISSEENKTITPTLKIGNAIGRPVAARATKVLDKRIEANSQESKEILAERENLRYKYGRTIIENRRSNRYMQENEKKELRTKIVRILCKSDEEVMKSIDAATKALVSKDTEGVVANIISGRRPF